MIIFGRTYEWVTDRLLALQHFQINDFLSIDFRQFRFNFFLFSSSANSIIGVFNKDITFVLDDFYPYPFHLVENSYEDIFRIQKKNMVINTDMYNIKWLMRWWFKIILFWFNTIQDYFVSVWIFFLCLSICVQLL